MERPVHVFSSFVKRHRILSRAVGLLLPMFMLALTLTVVSPSAVMAAPPPGNRPAVNMPFVLGCPTGGCSNVNNTDPVTTGCSHQSAGVIATGDVYDQADNLHLGDTQLWWSNGCGSNWSEANVYGHIDGPAVTEVQSKLWFKSPKYNNNVCTPYSVSSGDGTKSPYWTNQQWLPSYTDYAESWTQININDEGDYSDGQGHALSGGWSGC